MVEMEADTPAAASSDDAPRSAPGGSADAPVEAEGSAPPVPRPPPAAPPDVGALVKAKASFAEGVDRVGKTLEAATELVNQTLQQLHAQEHGHREQYEAELKELRRVRAVLSTFAGAEIDAAVQSPERGAPLAGVGALGG